VSDVCHILAGWQNQYNSENKRFSEANDGIAFVTTTGENTKKGKGKKKKVTCYKCKQDGHYSNECPEEEEKPENTHNNKKGANFLAKTEDPDD